jgi:hypothetical protein
MDENDDDHKEHDAEWDAQSRRYHRALSTALHGRPGTIRLQPLRPSTWPPQALNLPGDKPPPCMHVAEPPKSIVLRYFWVHLSHVTHVWFLLWFVKRVQAMHCNGCSIVSICYLPVFVLSEWYLSSREACI